MKVTHYYWNNVQQYQIKMVAKIERYPKLIIWLMWGYKTKALRKTGKFRYERERIQYWLSRVIRTHKIVFTNYAYVLSNEVVYN